MVHKIRVKTFLRGSRCTEKDQRDGGGGRMMGWKEMVDKHNISGQCRIHEKM